LIGLIESYRSQALSIDHRPGTNSPPCAIVLMPARNPNSNPKQTNRFKKLQFTISRDPSMFFSLSMMSSCTAIPEQTIITDDEMLTVFKFITFVFTSYSG